MLLFAPVCTAFPAELWIAPAGFGGLLLQQNGRALPSPPPLMRLQDPMPAIPIEEILAAGVLMMVASSCCPDKILRAVLMHVQLLCVSLLMAKSCLGQPSAVMRVCQDQTWTWPAVSSIHALHFLHLLAMPSTERQALQQACKSRCMSFTPGANRTERLPGKLLA